MITCHSTATCRRRHVDPPDPTTARPASSQDLHRNGRSTTVHTSSHEGFRIVSGQASSTPTPTQLPHCGRVVAPPFAPFSLHVTRAKNEQQAATRYFVWSRASDGKHESDSCLLLCAIPVISSRSRGCLRVCCSAADSCTLQGCVAETEDWNCLSRTTTRTCTARSHHTGHLRTGQRCGIPVSSPPVGE